METRGCRNLYARPLKVATVLQLGGIIILSAVAERNRGVELKAGSGCQEICKNSQTSFLASTLTKETCNLCPLYVNLAFSVYQKALINYEPAVEDFSTKAILAARKEHNDVWVS